EVAVPVAGLPTLSVLLGLAACESLAARLPSGHELRLKWPNDLQLGDAKLAGILMESATTVAGAASRLVIGMGLNLTGAEALTASLGRPIADWQSTGCRDSAADLCAAVATGWQQALAWAEARWHPEHGIAELPARYAALDALAGSPVQVQDDGKILMRGLAAGIAPDGRLLLRNDTGIHNIGRAARR